MIDPPGMTANISPKILKFMYSLHMVKDWPPPSMTAQYLT